MLRRRARERREYLRQREEQQRLQGQHQRRERLRKALEENRPLPPELRREALSLQKELELEIPRGLAAASHDDEYRWAGLEPPRVMITTSRDPSSRLRLFAKELCLLIPGARRLNRGRAELGGLVGACRAAGVTDLILVTETRGRPAGLSLCHLPHGPSAHFTLSGAVLRGEGAGKGPTAPTAPPHLLLIRMDSALGRRLGSILQHLFPVPRPGSRRVVTFANEDDVVLVRNHVYRRKGRSVELQEVGPRFQMRPYLIQLGTLEQGDTAEVEWRWHPYTATAPKRQLLSTP